jgi:hypothetical protein
VERKILTKLQLRQIEKEIDKIIELTNKLNPDNPNDAEILYFEDIKLDQYISVLERSYKNARIEESGLRVIG